MKYSLLFLFLASLFFLAVFQVCFQLIVEGVEDFLILNPRWNVELHDVLPSFFFKYIRDLAETYKNVSNFSYPCRLYCCT